MSRRALLRRRIWFAYWAPTSSRTNRGAMASRNLDAPLSAYGSRPSCARSWARSARWLGRGGRGGSSAVRRRTAPPTRGRGAPEPAPATDRSSLATCPSCRTGRSRRTSSMMTPGDADVIVLGTRAGGQDPPLGGTASAVVRAAQRPILPVRPDACIGGSEGTLRPAPARMARRPRRPPGRVHAAFMRLHRPVQTVWVRSP
jgi:hypothetical protein